MVAPTVKLSTGYLMPVIGLGTYESKPNEVGEAIKHAIDVGYRHFDCAYFYQNEAEIGAAFREKFADGSVTREELFVTTKLWCTFHSEDKVVSACKKSLENFGLDYIDLYLIHAPFGLKEDTPELIPYDDGTLLVSDVDYIDTWKGMESCVRLGLVRNIGLSNFNYEQIERILDIATFPPVNNQVECNPNIIQKKLRDYCKIKDIIITAYCPLGKPKAQGIEISSSVPQPNMENPEIIAIAKKCSKTPAQVILRYLIQREAYPLPKSVNKSRITENFDIFDFELSNEDMTLIDSLDTNSRVYTLKFAANHEHYPFNTEY